MSLFADNHREEFDLTDFMAFNKIYGQDTEESNQALIALLNTVTEDKPGISDTLIKDIDAFDSIDIQMDNIADVDLIYVLNPIQAVCLACRWRMNRMSTSPADVWCIWII